MKTRRAFIQTGAVALCGLAAAPALAKPRKPKDADWTETFDVIVIGSGLAAFVAGLSALESGAKRVALLEKMGMIGGSTAISNGTISVPGSPLQKAQGIEDSPEAMLKDLLKAGKGFCHPELTKTLVSNGVEAFDFIVKHGAKFKDTLMMPGGMTAKRLLQPDYNGATGLLAPLRESYLKMGGQLILCCKVDRLLLDRDGRVEGVAARTDYHFNTRLKSDDLENKGGTPVRYRAKRGVICCTGGFEADRAFRSQELPQFDGAFTTEHPGATASGYRMLAAAGARMINGTLYRPAFPCTDEQPLGMMIAPATGKRFVSESADRVAIFHAASKVLASNGRRMPLSILDGDAYELVENKHRMEKNAGAGYVTKHDSLEDLAEHYKIPLDALKATIEEYNAMAEKGEDTAFKADFAKTKNNKVDKPPYYAVMVKPNLTYSLAGALITAKAEVVSVLDDAPIPGLYAAGEATSGVHGAMRLGGCAILDCCVFGMLAGRNVMAKKV